MKNYNWTYSVSHTLSHVSLQTFRWRNKKGRITYLYLFHNNYFNMDPGEWIRLRTCRPVRRRHNNSNAARRALQFILAIAGLNPRVFLCLWDQEVDASLFFKVRHPLKSLSHSSAKSSLKHRLIHFFRVSLSRTWFFTGARISAPKRVREKCASLTAKAFICKLPTLTVRVESQLYESAVTVPLSNNYVASKSSWKQSISYILLVP